jgi:hypothetical protein
MDVSLPAFCHAVHTCQTSQDWNRSHLSQSCRFSYSSHVWLYLVHPMEYDLTREKIDMAIYLSPSRTVPCPKPLDLVLYLSAGWLGQIDYSLPNYVISTQRLVQIDLKNSPLDQNFDSEASGSSRMH